MGCERKEGERIDGGRNQHNARGKWEKDGGKKQDCFLLAQLAARMKYHVRVRSRNRATIECLQISCNGSSSSVKYLGNLRKKNI